MDAWLVSWLPAGRSFIDRVVTILPRTYSADDVAKVLDTLFYVGTLNLGETVHFRSNPEMKPKLYQQKNANGYLRLIIEFGSYALEARLVRSVDVETHEDRTEAISWEEQNHDGGWVRHSFRRRRSGTVSFALESD